jgi:hypothetical protein
MVDVRAGRTFLGALGLVALAAAACGDSSHQYIENEDLGVFARLPEEWAVYDTEQLLEAVDAAPASDRALERVLDRVWFRGFDASDEPTPEGTLELGPSDEPRGYVQVQQLSAQERDQINVTGLRAAVLGMDPVAGMPEDPLASVGQTAPDAQVLTDEPATFEGGFHGVHNVYAVPSDSDVAIVDQTALLDETNSVLYVFVVACNETCYFETDNDAITEIVDSWTIQEESS